MATKRFEKKMLVMLNRLLNHEQPTLRRIHLLGRGCSSNGRSFAHSLIQKKSTRVSMKSSHALDGKLYRWLW